MLSLFIPELIKALALISHNVYYVKYLIKVNNLILYRLLLYDLFATNFVYTFTYFLMLPLIN